MINALGPATDLCFPPFPKTCQRQGRLQSGLWDYGCDLNRADCSLEYAKELSKEYALYSTLLIRQWQLLNLVPQDRMMKSGFSQSSSVRESPPAPQFMEEEGMCLEGRPGFEP